MPYTRRERERESKRKQTAKNRIENTITLRKYAFYCAIETTACPPKISMHRLLPFGNKISRSEWFRSHNVKIACIICITCIPSYPKKALLSKPETTRRFSLRQQSPTDH